ncbi:MAG: DUF1552 domain-containing protein, partial [Bdellovibrionales bacterium]|nr:DUF1552 domain-containing protein [Bdellovibrionales bacterium]
MATTKHKRTISRRSFVKGIGCGAGSLLFAPTRFALGSERNPFRCIIFMEGNGVIPRFFASDVSIAAINAAGGNIGPNDYGDFNRRYGHSSVLDISNADLSQASALSSLASQAQGEPSIVDDTRVVLGLSNKVAGAGHTTHFGALSCSPSTARIPSAASIDHVLASFPEVRRASPFDVVRVGIHSLTTTPFNYNTCSAGERSPMPMICNPAIAYSNLFGSVAEGESAQAFLNRRKLLDFIRADVDATLSDLNGSPQMQYKIEKYGEAVDTLSVRHQTILGMEQRLREVAPQGPGPGTLYESTRSLDHLEVMFDLVKAALLGGLSNVAVLGSGTGGAFDLNYERLGYSGIGRHSLCHANNYTALNAVTDFHVSMVSRLAKSLKQIPEGSGSMLDNTVIVYLSDNGEKHHSNAHEWPMLVIGGANHGFGPGNRTLVYPR